MKQITDTTELRSIQMAILDEIVRICEKHNINYSLAGGTLIGAFRHKGYIPWDDDIDLYMMRQEYDRFLNIFNKETTQPYILMSPEISTNYIYTFGKVCDTRTLMIEDEVAGYELGVNVDIFPIDYVPENFQQRARIFRLRYLLYKIRRCKLSKKCFLRSRLAYYCYKLLPIPLSVIEALQRKYVFSRVPTKMVCDMSTLFPPKNAFHATCMDNFIKVEFEGKQYNSMAGYDEYMRNAYGDYMQLPPKEMQVHHHFKAWWK